MKKYLIVLIVALLCLTGCMSIKDLPVTPEIDMTIEGDNVAEVTIIPTMYEQSFNRVAGTHCYRLYVKNTSDSIIKVNWEKSTIMYNSLSSLIFSDGQKYAEANNPLPATPIPANGELSKNLYASREVYYSGGKYGSGWNTGVIHSFYTTVLICVEHDGEETYYTFNFSPSTTNEE